MELCHRRVNFRISDVCIPAPHEVLLELHGGDILQGTVIALSDSGTEPDAFAVVEVEGAAQPMIVSVERLLGVV